ncbi:MAG: hypothetical protein D6730_02730, partial [Bacteroidetes bacterium]
MGLKSFIGGLWSGLRARQIAYKARHALEIQQRTFHTLIDHASNTRFGKDHGFDSINTYGEFQQRVPVRNYEQARDYFDRIYRAEKDVSWPGVPIYLAKTSGTTSGAKYIPITRESIRMQIAGARDALMLYMHETGKRGFLKGKMMFLSGSPEIGPNEYGIRTGRLSGIVNHFVPN